MKNLETLEAVKLFYYSTQLPVFLIKDNQIISAYPSTPSLAESKIRDVLIPSIPYKQSYNMVQYVSTAFFEQLLVCFLQEGFVVVSGPFLIEPMSSQEIIEMIKTKKISIKQKSILDAHYGQIKLISSQNYYYTGQLMQRLFCESETIAAIVPSLEVSNENMDVLFKNIYKDREKMFAHPPFFLEKKLTNFIATGNLEGALDTLKEINRLERAVLADDPLRSLKDSVICSCTFITRAAIEAGVSPDIAFSNSDAFIQKIEKENTLSEVSQTEIDIISRYVVMVNDRLAKKYSHNIIHSMHYIDENLTTPLTLKQIANHIRINPNYLSMLFKKETGCAISSYISEQRVKESAFFVAYTDYEISDIAGLYQFCNQSYYITLFKKYIGETPGEYRTKNLKK